MRQVFHLKASIKGDIKAVTSAPGCSGGVGISKNPGNGRRNLPFEILKDLLDHQGLLRGHTAQCPAGKHANNPVVIIESRHQVIPVIAPGIARLISPGHKQDASARTQNRPSVHPGDGR